MNGYSNKGNYHMNRIISKNRQDIALKEAELANLNLCLKLGINNCHHQWRKTEYVPVIREAYTSPGDAPGTMGVDFRGPCHVPRSETRRWTRTCEECGLTQTTDKAKMVTPSLGNQWVMGTKQQMVEVPDFG
jgi:hypothetical protein